MCLAIPAKIESRDGDESWVRMGDARMRINVVMTPDVKVGDWVLVHAGFSIQEVDEEEAKATWELIEQIPDDEEQEIFK
ncbi:MAG TPA: HypC/HybG/HupF family hydrogenase formation chaperone [Phycisphaeraceae bacterium]|nr:HypC/HybG/HupF family hydrogenase formation chaperone [Phycisphaeraceae bacterium]